MLSENNIMASKTSYELHHHFPRLAEESGFTFNVHRPRIHIDWNKIRLIDVESIIKERKFVLLEQHLNDILYCVLESEFDVRILDEGVMKMFRLAQLAVEYQQFCRHYLDRSVYVLREEITALAQELDVTKKNLREKEEELRKLKRKTKHTYRTPLPYGNDNIANMILKTLTNKSDMFPSTSTVDALQYNKCSYCDKVFLNQLYLKSHLTRRHAITTEIPQKDVSENVQNTSTEKENSKLVDEITELKTKLKEMENLLTKVNSQTSANISPDPKVSAVNREHNNENFDKKMKDAEVSVNNEYNLLDKIEEWKKEEHEKYNKEINLLRTQIVEIVNSFKSKEMDKPVQNSEPNNNLIEELHSTIKQQGTEIHVLRQELINTRLASENEEKDRKKETEAQMSIWAKRVEVQTKQYEALLQKLNEVAQESIEARAQAEAERTRAAHLQVLLQESQNNKTNENTNKQNNYHNNSTLQNPNGELKNRPAKRKTHKSNPVADHKTLENLHRKAQELLNMESTSSSDASSASLEKAVAIEHVLNKKAPDKKNHKNSPDVKITNSHNKPQMKRFEKVNKHMTRDNLVVSDIKEQKVKREKSKSHLNIGAKMGNGTVVPPGSPMKLVRAKITEEVNSRLVTIGVDPLKNRLPKNYFQKQKMQLHQHHELKSKKNPDYQKVKHSILAYLDSNTSGRKKEVPDIQDYVSPQKLSKAFSLSSVISNVKSKALSLVKSNDAQIKSKRKELSAEVAKKAMSLLKTPPSSAPTSPAAQRLEKEKRVSSAEGTKQFPQRKNNSQMTSDTKNKQKSKKQMKPVNAGYTDDDSSESDHRYYNPAVVQQTAKSIESLIKSPARRPASATADYNGSVRKLILNNDDNGLLRSQSATNVSEYKNKYMTVQEIHQRNNLLEEPVKPNLENSSEESLSIAAPLNKAESERNIPKQTKGVLKNASSITSLSKKKVLFDMDAIQMKSVSASPSQSTTEKSDNNEKFELGLVNLDGEEWDISSIENEPLKNDTKIQVISRTSPKIAELKRTIESQLARRNETPSTALVGRVDLLPAPMARASSVAGSNTSLGSSILDESDGIPAVNPKAFIKPKKVAEKDDSEIDISEYSLDEGIPNKKGNDSF
ncbi:cilium assembly protein DZIP1L [Pectinophora gossypiella]|uniref:cilium assembly protein DZIP1L n=1 Tax=Pectinophora gossypiella TaxID=13191 RepID=UPI00214E4575|nr:cilium assembly protein DZIP1L [Pectinophora gossypiella]